MKNLILTTLIAASSLVFTPFAQAFEATEVNILKIASPNAGGHMYLTLSGNSNCPGTGSKSYAIIQGWGTATEPAASSRQVMHQYALTALTTGKKVQITGASCYLDNYLFADQITISM